MRPAAALLLATLTTLAACGGSGASTTSTRTTTATTGSTTGGPSNTEAADVAGITAAHNAARAAASPAPNPPLTPLTYDGTVAATAQAWANNCMFVHSHGQYGENLFAGAGATYSPADVVGSWVGEDANYDYATNTCASGQVCGHYTQVVWASSLRLGCGVANCTANSPFKGFTNWQLWVCNYDPPGNFVGEKPY